MAMTSNAATATGTITGSRRRSHGWTLSCIARLPDRVVATNANAKSDAATQIVQPLRRTPSTTNVTPTAIAAAETHGVAKNPAPRDMITAIIHQTTAGRSIVHDRTGR